jgi:hypothetical protein
MSDRIYAPHTQTPRDPMSFTSSLSSQRVSGCRTRFADRCELLVRPPVGVATHYCDPPCARPGGAGRSSSSSSASSIAAASTATSNGLDRSASPGSSGG